MGRVFQTFWGMSARYWSVSHFTLQWRHNERGSVSNHQRLHCLLNCRFRHRSKKTSKLRVTGLCVGNSPVTGGFPAPKASNAEMFPFDDVIMHRISNRLQYVAGGRQLPTAAITISQHGERRSRYKIIFSVHAIIKHPFLMLWLVYIGIACILLLNTVI